MTYDTVCHDQASCCYWTGSRSTHHAGYLSRQASHRSRRKVLLPTAPSAPSPTFTWRRICGNISSRICHEPHWLLQRPAGWCAESGDGVSSATRGSLTTVWRTFDTISYTGWMYQNASWERVMLCMTVYKCLHRMGPIYLPEMCRPSSEGWSSLFAFC